MSTPSKNPWDDRYNIEEYYYGTVANDFLVARVDDLPRGGAVLCLAEGEGRNAVFLAKNGFRVTAVDGSQVGLSKLKKLADQEGVQIETVCSDLADFDFGQDRWDAIVSIWCHLPPSLRDRVHSASVSALKAHGVFLLEAYHPRQLAYKTGGPPSAELMMTETQLRADFAALEIQWLRDLDRVIHEGKGHVGKSAVVQLIAVKKG